MIVHLARLCLLVGLSAGCRTELPPAAESSATGQAEPERTEPEPEPEPAEPAERVPPTRLVFPGTSFDHDFILDRLARAEPIELKPVGSTSTVFRMRMNGPIDAAFKTATRERPRGPIAEVAAYRLARCLNLPNVPPAVSRRIPLQRIDGLLAEESRPRWPAIAEHIVTQPDGTALGASIYWISDLSDVGVDRGAGERRFREWLRIDGELPDAERALAASVGTMLGFDYLIGNFDRFSGGNARGSADGQRVYPRDHDLSFPRAMPAALHRRLWKRVIEAERFSRAFYENLRALTRDCFELELSMDPEGAHGRLVGPTETDALFDRRTALLSHIDSLIALHGEPRVLLFD